jgi:FkbM family methyltransferase
MTSQSYARFLKVVKAAGLYPLGRSLRIWLDHHTRRGMERHRQLRRFYSAFLRQGDLCFDIGANVGDRAELFLELGARVVCVEPQRDCAKVLRRRFRDRPELTVVEKALGASEGTAELLVCDYNPGLATLSERWTRQGRYAGQYQWRRTVSIPMTTLDRLIGDHGVPAFCKIDVEGFEGSVLRGLSQPIPRMSLEFHREFLEETRKCLDRIASLGPASFNCTLRDAAELFYPSWLAADDLYARLKAMEDPSVWGDIYTNGRESVHSA